jgi:hypothetical protein
VRYVAVRRGGSLRIWDGRVVGDWVDGRSQ